MTKLRKISIEFEQYKAFRKRQRLQEIKPINIIIGRNNAGKSAVLDVVEYLKGDPPSRENFLAQGTNGATPSVLLEKELKEEELRKTFREGVIGGSFTNLDHWSYAVTNYLGKPVKIKVTEKAIRIDEIEPGFSKDTEKFKDSLEKEIRNPFLDKRVRRLRADRNILPEKTTPGEPPAIQSDGTGATRSVDFILRFNTANPKIIEENFVEAFNKIFGPDIKIVKIDTKELKDGSKEIHLEEQNKRLIPLSESGSGIKTVALVLLNTIAYPEHYKTNLSEYIFLLEELENNLHAHALRNLFHYIKSLATEFGCTFFITTHSSTVIDLFDNDPDAQIIHIVNHNGESELEVVSDWLDKSKVIDDLGIRGSDLLQTNGIIWVEGPSDRIYINHWITLLSNGELIEGTHYQCLFYGGKLLSNLSLSDPLLEEYISMLKINKNLVIVIDSDKSGARKRINRTKQRIRKETSEIGGMTWVTKGREVENYIQKEIIESILGKVPDDFDEFTKVSDLKPGKMNKIAFAREAIEKMDKERLDNLDLHKRIAEIIEQIKEWNK